nr:MAG TPA: hypothetical protein [Bacteriophage sp.]
MEESSVLSFWHKAPIFLPMRCLRHRKSTRARAIIKYLPCRLT